MAHAGESHRLRDLQSITDAALAYLPLEALLDELLTRVKGILSADTAAILLIDADQRHLVARAAKGLEEEVERRVRIPVGRGFAGRIAADRRPVIIEDVDHSIVLNPILRQKGVKSLLGVPLLVEGNVLGVLHVGTLQPRRFTDEDVGVLQRVADRAALAIQARVSDRERGLADALQQSLIPPNPPRIPGLSLAGRYFPAAEAALGGDWYDAFMLPNGTVGAAVGDVVGRGFRAAALMAQLRSALRAYALVAVPPAEVAGRLNTLLRQLEPEHTATMLYLVLDPGTKEVCIVAAGHPPPVLVRRDGRSELIELPVGAPLGARPLPAYREQLLQVEGGDTLLLYTDGLVEHRDEPLQEGLRRLRDAVRGPRDEVEAVCDAAIRALLPDGAELDDAALLALSPEAVNGRLELQVPAEREFAPLVRRLLGGWLRTQGASQREIEYLTLATAEACGNAMEHAYAVERADFDVTGTCERGEVTIEVRDYGTWRPPRGVNRGRGLQLMQALTDSVDIREGEPGTAVTLRKRLGGAEETAP